MALTIGLRRLPFVSSFTDAIEYAKTQVDGLDNLRRRAIQNSRWYRAMFATVDQSLFAKQRRRNIFVNILELPTELRHMIYARVCGPGCVYVVHSSGSTERPGSVASVSDQCIEASRSDGLNFDLLWGTQSPGVLECDNLGHRTFTDMVQYWYQTNTFVMNDMSVMRLFGISDCWSAKVVPIHNIKSVQLAVHENKLTFTTNGLPSATLSKVLSGLVRMHQFSEGVTFRIHITSKSCSLQRSGKKAANEPIHKCKIWMRDRASIAEFVENLEKALFKEFDKFLVPGSKKRPTKHILKCVLDQDLVIDSQDTKPEYEAWCQRIMNYSVRLRVLLYALRLTQRRNELKLSRPADNAQIP